MHARHFGRLLVVSIGVCCSVHDGRAADVAKATPAAVLRTTLPQQHEYQRQLRSYLATLTEADFAHGVQQPLATVAGSVDPEVQFRNYIFTQMSPPLLGSKRGPRASAYSGHDLEGEARMLCCNSTLTRLTESASGINYACPLSHVSFGVNFK